MFDDVTWWIESVFYVVLFLVFYSFGWYRRGQYEKTEAFQSHEFQWKCPTKGCTFQVSTNDKSVTDHIATGHMKYELSK